MASTTEGDKKWKRRRLSLAKAEKMRAAKRVRAEASTPISLNQLSLRRRHHLLNLALRDYSRRSQ